MHVEQVGLHLFPWRNKKKHARLPDSSLMHSVNSHDFERSIGIAGVMGGLNSEIEEDTKTVILESANFLGSSIRTTSKKLGLRTEASARFEKGIDPNLAEAAAERLHQQVRTTLWGYAPQEQLTMDELHAEKFQGIRPAVGYPSLPDVSINFLIDRLISFESIGVTLTEHGMMQPHASVSGLMFSHPKAHYFSIGEISEEQLQDYARRRNLPADALRKYLS